MYKSIFTSFVFKGSGWYQYTFIRKITILIKCLGVYLASQKKMFGFALRMSILTRDQGINNWYVWSIWEGNLSQCHEYKWMNEMIDWLERCVKLMCDQV